MRFGGFKGQTRSPKNLDMKKFSMAATIQDGGSQQPKCFKNLSNNDTTIKFGGFKGQRILYPKQLLDMQKIQYGGYNPRWRLTTIEMLEKIFQTMIQP